MLYRHVRFYSYKIENDGLKITLITDVAIPSGVKIFGWSIFNNVVGCLLEDSTMRLCFSRVNLDSAFLTNLKTVSFKDVVFESIEILDGVCGFLCIAFFSDEILVAISL